MPNRPLPLFTFSGLLNSPPITRANRCSRSASQQLRRLLAAASANDVPDADERALVLDLHSHLRRRARAD